MFQPKLSVVCGAIVVALTACGPTAVRDPDDAAGAADAAADTAEVAADVITPAVGTASGATVVTAESGGVVLVAGAKGTQLTLAFAPHALPFDTTVTCLELTGLTGAPLTTFIGGVQCAPNGLSLALPATLTIQTPDALPADALVGVTVQDDGSDLRLVLAKRQDAKTVTVTLTHFTGWGAGTAQPGQQPPPLNQVWTRASAEAALTALQVIAQQSGQPAALPTLAQILQGWFDSDLEPKLLAQNAAIAEATFADAMAWQSDVYQNGVDGILAATLAKERVELAGFLAAVVQSHVNKCNAGNDFAEAQLAMQWYARIQSLGLEAQSGLDLATFQANFCVRVQILSGAFGPMTSDGTSGRFDATYTYTIGSAAPANNRPFRVRASTVLGLISPASTVTSPGQGYHGDTSPMPAGADMTVHLEVCVLPFDGIACADASDTDTHSAPCGHVGVVCCGGGACDGGLSCQGGVCKAACGHASEPCCGGNNCNQGLQCNTGVCEPPCGASGQPCCLTFPNCTSGLFCGTGNTCAPPPCDTSNPLACTLGAKKCVSLNNGLDNAWMECVLNDVGCPQWPTFGSAIHYCAFNGASKCSETGGAHCDCECASVGATKCYDQGEGYSVCKPDVSNGATAQCLHWQGNACTPGQQVVGCNSCACKPDPPACSGGSPGTSWLTCAGNNVWSCVRAANGCVVDAIDGGLCDTGFHCSAGQCLPN